MGTDKEDFVTMSIMVEPALKEGIEAMAREEENSVSAIARRILRPAVFGKGKGKGKNDGRRKR